MAWALLATVLVTAAIIVARKARSEPARWVLVAALAGAPLLGLVLPRAPLEPSGLPRLEPSGRYVGSASCAPCHPSEHASWQATYHRTMTQVARGQAILAPSGQIEVDGRRIEVSRAGDGLFITMPDPAELDAAYRLGRDPTSVPSLQREVVLTTGSHHYQAYWVKGAREGELRAAPIVWHRELERFVPRHDVFLQPPTARDHLVRWNSNCLVCHATGAQPGHDAATDLFDTEAVELGIACEACHGPGALHTERMRDPLARYLAQDDDRQRDIVHPAQIDRARSTALCGQCHAYSYPRDEEEWWTHGYARSFQAGDELSASRLVLTPRSAASILHTDQDALFWLDGTIRVGGREYNGLTASSCFQRGSGDQRVACIDCHQLHGSDPNGQLSEAGRSGASCNHCHDGFDTPAHTHHPEGSIGATCYGCHMPKVSYALYRAQRSHRIDSPSVEVAVRTGRPPACNLCHVDETLAWTQEALTQFGVNEQLEIPPEELPLMARMALEGDAASRVIAADALGKPLTPTRSDLSLAVLAQLLEDPYAAIRLVAARGLVQRGVMAADAYDYLGAPESWAQLRASLTSRLGPLDARAISSAKSRRDDRPIFIAE